jgi:hypothetical protein
VLLLIWSLSIRFHKRQVFYNSVTVGRCSSAASYHCNSAQPASLGAAATKWERRAHAATSPTHPLNGLDYTRNIGVTAIGLFCYAKWKLQVPELLNSVASELYRSGGRRWSAKLVPTFADRGCRVVSATDPQGRNFNFLDWSRYYFFQVAPQLSSWGWVDHVPDPLLLRKSGSAGNLTRDPCICSQKLWPLDHRGGQLEVPCLRNLITHRIWETWNLTCFPVFHYVTPVRRARNYFLDTSM